MIRAVKSKIKNTLPANLIALAHYSQVVLSDIRDSILGRRPELVPPKRMIFVGDGDFIEIGEEFLGYFQELAGLQPDQCVLDVACGIGRMARPLTRFLSSRGRYEGFDIVESGINWCTKNISLKYPNFKFQCADIYNKKYRRKGKIKASEFAFPFPENHFDFIFATSLFTHMYPEDIRHYLSEISRTMKPDGRCLITFFLWNAESSGLVRSGKSTINFHPFRNFWVLSTDIPERAVAVEESSVMGLFEDSGFKIENPVRYGSWCGRHSFLSYQDVVIARKYNAGVPFPQAGDGATGGTAPSWKADSDWI